MSIIQQNMPLDEAWSKVIEQVKQAASEPGHPFRYLSFATAGKDRAPAQRMVVLRGFEEQKSLFRIYTDLRSHKVEQIQENESVSLLFYDDQQKLQLSVEGTARILSEPGEKMKYWNQIGTGSTHSYTSLKSPGEKIDHPEDAYEWELTCPDYFCVIEVKAERMQFLQLNGHRHLRALRFRGEEPHKWKQQWMAP